MEDKVIPRYLNQGTCSKDVSSKVSGGRQYLLLYSINYFMHLDQWYQCCLLTCGSMYIDHLCFALGNHNYQDFSEQEEFHCADFMPFR